MQSKSFSVAIPCPLHPSEFVQRVDMELHCSQQLYCLECIVQSNESGGVPSTLRPINDLINQASDYYAQTKNQLRISSEVPQEFSNVLANQDEKLEQLSNHIELQKQLVITTFQGVTEAALSLIESKKNEYLNELDNQLFNFRYWYTYIDKQIKKAYPNAEDINHLYPSKEDLQARLQKLTNVAQLTALVRNLKEDLAESRLDRTSNPENSVDSRLQVLTRKLTTIENLRPSYASIEGYELIDLKRELKEFFEVGVSKLLSIQNEVNNVVGDGNYGSKLINTAEFKMIKSWLPKDVPFNPKLLYRGTRDGMNVAAFHEKCDKKGSTITIAKCKFANSNTPAVIGGFLDKNWESPIDGQYIASSNAFVFSVTKKKRSYVSDSQSAAWHSSSEGPNFGSGSDLAINFETSENYCSPSTYSDLHLAPNGSYNYEEEGGSDYFDLIEIEVYKV